VHRNIELIPWPRMIRLAQLQPTHSESLSQGLQVVDAKAAQLDWIASPFPSNRPVPATNIPMSLLEECLTVFVICANHSFGDVHGY
jgi:hypothetical protein